MRIGSVCSGIEAASRAVRRLTPIECERLQGFPDNFTRIPYRGKPAGKCPDGPRYKALGNSWAVPKFTWLFKRIDEVDQMARMASAEGASPRSEAKPRQTNESGGQSESSDLRHNGQSIPQIDGHDVGHGDGS